MANSPGWRRFSAAPTKRTAAITAPMKMISAPAASTNRTSKWTYSRSSSSDRNDAGNPSASAARDRAAGTIMPLPCPVVAALRLPISGRLRGVQRWRGVESAPPGWGRCVVTIGVFDGVHRGHQQIIGRAVERSRELGVASVVLTFDPHPSEGVRPGTHPPMLSSQRYKAELLEGLGVDVMCVLPFTAEFSRLGPDEFVPPCWSSTCTPAPSSSVGTSATAARPPATSVRWPGPDAASASPPRGCRSS